MKIAESKVSSRLMKKEYRSTQTNMLAIGNSAQSKPIEDCTSEAETSVRRSVTAVTSEADARIVNGRHL